MLDSILVSSFRLAHLPDFVVERACGKNNKNGGSNHAGGLLCVLRLPRAPNHDYCRVLISCFRSNKQYGHVFLDQVIWTIRRVRQWRPSRPGSTISGGPATSRITRHLPEYSKMLPVLCGMLLPEKEVNHLDFILLFFALIFL